jgi:hypothetical protein
VALGREMDHMVGRESGEGVVERAPVAHVDLGESVTPKLSPLWLVHFPPSSS